MTPTESLALTRFVRAACPQQKFDEYTPDAWHELLSDLDYEDVRTVTKALAKSQPFISPAEIRIAVRRLRAERIDKANPGLVPDADPDNVPAYLAALRAGRVRAGNNPGDRYRPEVIETVDSAVKYLPAHLSTQGATA